MRETLNNYISLYILISLYTYIAYASNKLSNISLQMFI